MAEFLKFLGLPEDSDEETASLAFTAILTSAVRDVDPEITVADAYQRVASLNGSQYLDPLHVLPLLIDSCDPKAQDLVGILGECCSAKEALIAAQECLERLARDLQRDRDSDEDEEEEEATKAKRGPIDTLVTIIDLYTSVIPRIKPRNKSKVDTVRPHLTEIQEAIEAAEYRLREDDAPTLLSSVAGLAKAAHSWLEVDTNAEPSAAIPRENVLFDLLCRTLTSGSHTIRTSIAQRTFEDLYPRFKRRQGGSWQQADEAFKQAFEALEILGHSPEILIRTPSITSLIALAHIIPLEKTTDPETLSPFLPFIIASIQTNSLLDESLAILLKFLCQSGTAIAITDSIAGPLLSVLPELASGHSDPQVRHLTFRILSRLLSLTPPALRMEILVDLTANSEFPQMRAAAVGLVKEALLEAFESNRESPFASPVFLQRFGPILFQSNPPDLLTKHSTSLDEFEESQEPRRLVECLSLYYVLLERDANNLTGIRDADVVLSIEKSLLRPLRLKLSDWESMGRRSDDGHDHHITPLLPLQISLERVDSAKTSLKL